MPYNSLDASARAQFSPEQPRYSIAESALYAIALLGGLVMTAISFARIQRAGLLYRIVTWLRVACVFFTLYCIFYTCVSVLSTRAEINQAGLIQTREWPRQRGVRWPISLVGFWLHDVTHSLILIAILYYGAAMSPNISEPDVNARVCRTVALEMGIVLNIFAVAILGMNAGYPPDYLHWVNDSLLAVSAASNTWKLVLAFKCLMAATVLCATGLTVARLPGEQNLSKLPALASILLLLSVIYQIVFYIHVIRGIPLFIFSISSYHRVLGATLDTWAVLGALSLLVVVGEKWNKDVKRSNIMLVELP